LAVNGDRKIEREGSFVGVFFCLFVFFEKLYYSIFEWGLKACSGEEE